VHVSNYKSGTGTAVQHHNYALSVPHVLSISQVGQFGQRLTSQGNWRMRCSLEWTTGSACMQPLAVGLAWLGTWRRAEVCYSY
jgi:hypothetical protein